MSTLQAHLELRLPRLEGPWVQRNSGYEVSLAQALGMKAESARYWDALWGHERIEFKKGRSVWLDLVRYSEQLNGIDSQARLSVTTLFFIPDPTRSLIKEVIAVETAALIAELALTPALAKTLLELRESVPRSLNAQASLTPADLRRISTFTVC